MSSPAHIGRVLSDRLAEMQAEEAERRAQEMTRTYREGEENQ